MRKVEAKYVEVYKNPEWYITFPSLVYLEDTNEVIVAFRQAGNFSVENAKKRTPTHHDNDSRCCIISSKDGGESYIRESFKVVTDIEFGVNDPGISRFSDGRLLLRNSVVEVKKTSERSKLQTQLVAHRPDLSSVSAIAGQTIQYSDDNGLTWSSPAYIRFDGCENDFFVSREPIIQLEDGVLMFSVYKSLPDKSDNSYVVMSWDNGKTWGDVSLIATDSQGINSLFQGISFNETALLNIGSGRILAMIRADSSYHMGDAYMAIGGVGELYASFSDNAGFSWSKPRPTGVWGQPAHLCRLKNGNILCTYGYRREPYSVRAVLSYDNGNSWDTDNIIIVKENAPFWDMGYPSSSQRNDGKIITVYYWLDENENRYIESAIWEL